MGKYNHDHSDDLTLPDGTSIPVESTQRDIHYKFGQSWRVNQTDSLFYHDAVPFAYYDEPNFLPELQFPLRLPEWAQYLKPEMDLLCEDRADCQFDYIMTFDKDFAKSTAELGDWARWLQTEAARKCII